MAVIVGSFGFALPAPAQDSAAPVGRPLAAVIDEYVREGLTSNLSLKAQSLEVERADAALDEARARYFPEVGFAARYSRSEGGRTIELPLGAALNPAYQTLNEMLVAQGQAAAFPDGAERDHRLPARDRAGHAPHAAHAHHRAGHPGRGARAARVVRCDGIFAPGAGAPAEARHHGRLPALAHGGAQPGHRRCQRHAAQREPARQRLAVPQRQDHAGPGAARARRTACRSRNSRAMRRISPRRRRATSISC